MYDHDVWSKSIYGNKHNLNESMSYSEKYVTSEKKTEKTDTVLNEEITNSLAQMREEHPILQD